MRLGTRQYCALVFALGCAVAAPLASHLSLGYIDDHPLKFGILAAGVILGEMLPLKIPRRGNDEEIVLSTSFSIALLLVGGLAPALIAQGTASVLQDLISRKPRWRIRFNLGQYTLSMAAAFYVMRVLSVAHVGSSHPFTDAELPAVLFGAATFFVVNAGLVGIAVALYQGVSPRRYFGQDLPFVAATCGLMLFLVPIVIAAMAYSSVLVPLFLAPMLAMYNTVWQGARSEHAARHDALTGLPNRFAFHDSVGDLLGETRQAAMLLMDLDRFKEVNDTLGHHYGDLLLQQVAERLREHVDEEDEIARLGGDEFAIFSPGSDRDSALALARRVADSLHVPVELEQIVLDAQTSVGIALYPQDGQDMDTLLQKADVAMYRAKETHTNVALYEERYDHHSPAKLALTADLRMALESEQIIAFYQPVLELSTSQVSSMEALVRWEHPHLGLLSPASFLDMAEQTSLIKPLTQTVLQSALAQTAQWHEAGLDLAVAVNVSTRVLTDHLFVEGVLKALESSGVPPDKLKLEVTESTLMADPVTARAVLQELDQIGVKIVIDDFGTGYSSLAYLAELPVDTVKIDQSFVSRMTSGSRDTIIVSSTIDLAHHLGMRAVAEGVEDPGLKPQLRELGCDAVQGYAISRPLPGADATRWLIAARHFTPAPSLLTTAA